LKEGKSRVGERKKTLSHWWKYDARELKGGGLGDNGGAEAEIIGQKNLCHTWEKKGQL